MNKLLKSEFTQEKYSELLSQLKDDETIQNFGDYYAIMEIPTLSEQDIKSNKIAELQTELNATDYKAIKFAEGHYTEEEYAPIKISRQILRDKINELRK